MSDVAVQEPDKTPRVLPTSYTVRLGVLPAVVGGGLDAYTYVSRGGVFANAQTGNVVLMAIEAARAQWRQALDHLPPILAGVAAAESLKRPRAVASVQVSAFRKLVDTPYGTAMTTGNLRTAAFNAYQAVVERDTGAARRARRFAAVILAFTLGALGGARLTATAGDRAVWAGAALFLATLVLFVRDERSAAPGSG
jgi:uncharacterized membrane protein YoaK (UPF0700 family)